MAGLRAHCLKIILKSDSTVSLVFPSEPCWKPKPMSLAAAIWALYWSVSSDVRDSKISYHWKFFQAFFHPLDLNLLELDRRNCSLLPPLSSDVLGGLNIQVLSKIPRNRENLDPSKKR